MRVVLITGPARGIGAALARRLAARGDTLSLVGMEPELLAALATELGAGHAWFECDVTDQGSLDRAVEETVRRFGRIDVVVANAGIASAGTVAITPVEALARVIEVNLVGVIRTVRTTMPHLLASRGYYLLVASAAALAPTPGLAAYGAAKSGVEQFGNGLRLELAGAGVDVGVAYPSWIDTDLVRDASEMETFLARLSQLPGPFWNDHPSGRVHRCSGAGNRETGGPRVRAEVAGALRCDPTALHQPPGRLARAPPAPSPSPEDGAGDQRPRDHFRADECGVHPQTLVILRELALLSFRLGATAFGGPAAHIAMMEREVVERRRWMTGQEFLDLLSAANLIPGPNSTHPARQFPPQRSG